MPTRVSPQGDVKVDRLNLQANGNRMPTKAAIERPCAGGCGGGFRQAGYAGRGEAKHTGRQPGPAHNKAHPLKVAVT